MTRFCHPTTSCTSPLISSILHRLFSLILQLTLIIIELVIQQIVLYMFYVETATSAMWDMGLWTWPLLRQPWGSTRLSIINPGRCSIQEKFVRWPMLEFRYFTITIITSCMFEYTVSYNYGGPKQLPLTFELVHLILASSCIQMWTSKFYGKINHSSLVLMGNSSTSN